MQSKMHNTCVLKIVVVLLSDGYMFTKIGFRVVHGINLGRGFEPNLSAEFSVIFSIFLPHLPRNLFTRYALYKNSKTLVLCTRIHHYLVSKGEFFPI